RGKLGGGATERGGKYRLQSSITHLRLPRQHTRPPVVVKNGAPGTNNGVGDGGRVLSSGASAAPLPKLTFTMTSEQTPTAQPQPPPAEAARPSRPAGLWRGWVRPFLFVVLGLFAFRSVVLDWNVVPSGSMKPTIVEGDYILVNKLAYDLKVPFLGAPLVDWWAPRRDDM